MLVFCFCSEFMESKQKKGRRKKKAFLEEWLKWELWLGNSRLGTVSSLQKQDTKINLHTNL